MSESACGGASDSRTDCDKDLSYPCNTCSAQFRSRYKRDKHLEQSDCGFTCLTCDRDDFASKQGMKAHHKRTHNESISGILTTCDYCGNQIKKTKGRYENQDNHYCDQSCFGKHRKELWNKGEKHPREGSDGLTGSDNPAWEGGKAKFECDTCGKVSERAKCELENTENNFCSPKCRVKWMETRMSGESHPQWKGGHAKYYGENWQKQRNKALKRDNHTCRACGASKEELQKSPDVHHLKRIMWYKNQYDSPEWWERANELENLITLCRSCHQRWEGIPLKPELL